MVLQVNKTIKEDAKKLNIIVVITTWLPLFACKYPGIYAQAAPTAAEHIIHNNNDK